MPGLPELVEPVRGKEDGGVVCLLRREGFHKVPVLDINEKLFEPGLFDLSQMVQTT